MTPVHLSSHFHQYTNGAGRTQAAANTVRDAMDELDRQYPGLRFRIIDEQDRIRPHINIFVGNEKARSIDEPVPPDTEIYILAALSGG